MDVDLEGILEFCREELEIEHIMRENISVREDLYSLYLAVKNQDIEDGDFVLINGQYKFHPPLSVRISEYILQNEQGELGVLVDHFKKQFLNFDFRESSYILYESLFFSLVLGKEDSDEIMSRDGFYIQQPFFQVNYSNLKSPLVFISAGDCYDIYSEFPRGLRVIPN